MVEVSFNGTINWMFPELLRSYCPVDIRYFPFDKQSCMLEFQSWSRTKEEISVYTDFDKPFQSYSFIQTEWDLLNISVSYREVNDFVWLEFILSLKRNHDYYG